MNNKYDVGNFSKILDEYKTEDEIEAIHKHLLAGVDLTKPGLFKFDFVQYESKKYNLS